MSLAFSLELYPLSAPFPLFHRLLRFTAYFTAAQVQTFISIGLACKHQTPLTSTFTSVPAKEVF
jgi:antibiotic biosynthesis monooxygenase (ABM) superfamily enzyme